MAIDDLILVALIVAGLALFVLALLVLRRRATARPDSASDFVFSTPQEVNRQQFIYQVAGLIKAATSLQTHVVALGKYEALDVEVHRGMRCVGVVSVMSPGEVNTFAARLRAIAQVRSEKGVKTAYLVSGGLFTDDMRQRAKRAGVTLLDGAALKRIEANARAGRYVKRQDAPPKLTEAEARRWHRPAAAAPVHPAARVEPSLEVTQERRIKLPPWVEFR